MSQNLHFWKVLNRSFAVVLAIVTVSCTVPAESAYTESNGRERISNLVYVSVSTEGTSKNGEVGNPGKPGQSMKTSNVNTWSDPTLEIKKIFSQPFLFSTSSSFTVTSTGPMMPMILDDINNDYPSVVTLNSLQERYSFLYN